MFKTAIKEFLIFSEAEYKAFMNSVIIPIILIYGVIRGQLCKLLL